MMSALPLAAAARVARDSEGSIVADHFKTGLRRALGSIAIAAITCTSVATTAVAQGTKTIRGAEYKPTSWVDPDGCQHWVMDDGAEGYMTPNVNRHGIPVCDHSKLCGMMNADQFFASGSYRITSQGRARLAQFFQQNGSDAYIIIGHTDSRGSDESNMKLSFNRAATVANVGASTGANIVDVRGYGERMPRASNKTSVGRAENRRVEIMCLN